MNKKFYLLILTFFSINSAVSQFDEEMSKTELYDKAMDMNIYLQMLAKDKLFLINYTEKELVSSEFDYALAKIVENLNDIDINETNPKIITQLDQIKKFWKKFNLKATQNLTLKNFTNFYFEVNTFDRLLSDLIEKMKENYQLPQNELKKYNEIQQLRKLIQKITLSYYANNLNLSKSFMHQYKKDIQSVDQFIKQKSNLYLNDPSSENLFSDVIMDWSFLKTYLFRTKLDNIKTILSLSISIDYKLKTIKNHYINTLNKGF